MPSQDPKHDENTAPDATVERRVALRRGAAVLAGVAGLSAAAAATGSSASAAPGDPVVLGANNVAGNTLTSITTTNATSTLAVSNAGTGAPLRVAPQVGAPSDTSAVGDLHSSDFFDTGVAFATYTHITGTGPGADSALWGNVYTDAWAVQPLAIVPQRALDTRSAAGRARVVNPAGNFDASGRLLGGHTITLTLGEYAIGFGSSVFANITVVSPTAQGFVSVYPADPRPLPSSINFAANQTLSNFAFSGFSFDGNDSTVRIFALVTTHVIFDVTGFAVGSSDFINPEFLPPAPASATAARVQKIDPAKAPAWYKAQRAQPHR
jgi:hypothetical protein